MRALGGIIDYVVGTPLTKVYCLAEHPDPKQQHYLNLYKMGDGPLYSFFIPYHLVHFEVPNAIARVVLLPRQRRQAARRSGRRGLRGGEARALKAGEVLDDYGMYMTYGEAVNADEMSSERYLPEGLGRGLPAPARHPEGRGAHATTTWSCRPAAWPTELRAEQYRVFRGESWLADHISAPAGLEVVR